MEKLNQFGIFILVLFVGLFLTKIVPAPIPPAVYGMLILYILLRFKVVKSHEIMPVTNRLLDIMPFLFVPAGVAMINEISNLRGKILLILALIFITTFLVLFVTGHAVQITQKIISKRNKEKDIDNISKEVFGEEM